MGYVSLHLGLSVGFAIADVLTRRDKKFQTQEWSLETEDGRVIQLLDQETADPFQNTLLQGESKPQEAKT